MTRAGRSPAPEQVGPQVHPAATVDPGAELEEGVRIGPHAVIANHTRIGAGTWIGPNAVIEEWTTLGRDCRVHPAAVLGGVPQDRHFEGERSFLRIGDRVTVREGASANRATGEDAETVIGDDTQLLAYSCVGHNCQIGSGVIVTAYTGLGGHVVVEDRAVLGGWAGVFPFVRIGRIAMVAAFARASQDVPPYMLVEGDPLRIVTINRVGLQRAGMPPEIQEKLDRAHRLLTRSGLDVSHALERIEQELGGCREVQHLVQFIRESQARGAAICR